MLYERMGHDDGRDGRDCQPLLQMMVAMVVATAVEMVAAMVDEATGDAMADEIISAAEAVMTAEDSSHPAVVISGLAATMIGARAGMISPVTMATTGADDRKVK